MSQENVEIVRRGLAAWTAGDMNAVQEVHDPDVSAWPLEGWPEPGPYVGREAVLGWYEQIKEVWDTDAMEPISVIDKDDRVVVRLLWRAAVQGPETNMELTRRMRATIAKRRGASWKTRLACWRPSVSAWP